MTNPDPDTIILMREWNTRIVTRDSEVNYHQNDTVIIIINGRVEIIDKTAFRGMLQCAADDDNGLAAGILKFVVNAS